jgi:hypothetical protein
MQKVLYAVVNTKMVCAKKPNKKQTNKQTNKTNKQTKQKIIITN